MRGRLERSKSGALAGLVALFAAFTAVEAGADGLARDSGKRAAACDAERGCVRISGYIAAGADFTGSEKMGGDFGALTHAAPAVQDPADAASRGAKFLPASQDDSAR